jgi:hypothetical protein
MGPINGLYLLNLSGFDGGLGGGGAACGRGFGGGEEDGEGGAFADFAFDLDVAVVVFDDFLADGEAEACAVGFVAAGGAFGGEEGLEDFWHQFFGDAGAVVDDLDFDLVFALGGFDGERAAFSEHGLAGVDEKIEEDLLYLDAVGEDIEIGLHLEAQGDAVFLRIAGEDRQGFVDDVLDGDGGEGGLAAGEIEHGGADFPGLLRAGESLGEGFANQRHVGLVALGTGEGELGIADDGGEKIVEFVGDDGGDGADGRHALGFGELVMELIELFLRFVQLAQDGLLGSGDRVAHVSNVSVGSAMPLHKGRAWYIRVLWDGRDGFIFWRRQFLRWRR